MRKIIIGVLCCLMFILPLGCNRSNGSTQKMSFGGDSMAPTFKNGEKINVDTGAYISSQPQKGDVIAFKDESGVVMIKRVIGLPGEQLEIKDGKVYTNGKEITEDYLNKQNNTESNGNSKWQIPDKNVFVMGDNRSGSKDSRVFGPVAYDRILGKVMK